jgi:competence protein ComEC
VTFVARYYPHVLAAALGAGLAAASLVRPGALGALCAAAAAAGAVLSPRLRLVLLGAALASCGWWWGGVRLDALDASALAPRAGEAALARVVVIGPARSGLYSVRAPGVVERFGGWAVHERVQLELPVGRSPPQGSRLELVARLALPEPASGGGFDERRWLRRQGVQVVVHGGEWRVVGRRGGIGGLADRIRARLARTVAPGLDGERRAVVQGIVLGADEGLGDDLRDAFRASGLYHLLAVSGSNVLLLVGGVLGLGWLLGIPRVVGHVAALVAIGAYVLAVGPQPSVIRAGVAGALASLAWLAARPRDRWYFLLVGGVLLLAWNPYTLLDAGFQLSFTAVAAIFTCERPIRRRLEGYPMPEPLRGVLSVSIACGVVTAPILWLQFDRVPVYSVPANALAAPAMPLLLGSALAAAALDPVLPRAAAALAVVEGGLAAYLAACARAVAGLPFAQVGSVRAVAGLAAALVLAYALARLPRRRGYGLTVLATGGATAIVVGAVALRDPPAALPPPQGLRVRVLDVGQGDGILLQTRGEAVLVDEGPPEAHVARQLRRLGVKRLSVVVLTHPQRDHVGGAAEVLAYESVGLVLDPHLPFDSPYERAALDRARQRRVRVVTARAGEEVRLGALRLRVVWPDGPGPPGMDPNDHATVVLASYGSFDALLTADAESNVTLPLDLPPVELLKVAHHGSADAGLPELLERLRPRVAVISVAAVNDYGHPTPSTLAALAAAPGLAVYRTDRDGAVTVETDGTRFTVTTERGQ